MRASTLFLPKRGNLLLLALVFCVTLCSASAKPPKQVEAFYKAVNEQWLARNYRGVLDLINKRLEKNPGDILALYLKAEYYAEIEVNVAQARQAASDLVAAVNAATKDKDFRKEAGEFAAAIAKVDSAHQLSPIELADFNRQYGVFPQIESAVELWGKVAGVLPRKNAWQRMREIIVPSVDFKDATIKEFAEWFNKTTPKLDPSGAGFTMKIDPSVAPYIHSEKFTLLLRDAPLSEVIMYATRVSLTRYRIEENQVIIIPEVDY